MLVRGIALLVVLAGCAHSPARTDSARTAEPPIGASPAPVIAASAPETPPTIAPPATATPPESRRSEPGATPVEARVDFSRDIRPILERCQPCHFPGGRMYDKLPFDRAATIRTLGPKLFRRIKAEDEQALIRRFLAQPE